LPHFVALSGPKSAFRGSNLKLAGHRWAPPLLTTRTRSLGPLLVLARQLEGLSRSSGVAVARQA
jgi:hypothetical protein